MKPKNGATVAAPLPGTRLLGMMWWIDRWRVSNAFAVMDLEQQGAYRNLLDEAYLRGGTLPDDSKVLAKASGDPARWPVLAPVVLQWFQRDGDGRWRNKTLSEVRHQAERRATNQRHYRERQKQKSKKRH